MNPPLPTDESTNDFFRKVIDWLEQVFGYGPEGAESMVRVYYSKFRDSAYCESIGIPVQDDDFFQHEGAPEMARRVHYYIGLSADPSPFAYLEWRRSQKLARRRADFR